MALAFDFGDVNWLAVLACGVASMALGFLWYGPLFGKAWARAMGWERLTADEAKAKQRKAGPGYALSLVGALVAAYVLALVVQVAGASSAADALVVGVLFWLAFLAFPFYVNAFFQETSIAVARIGVGYRFVEYAVFALVLTLWP